MLKPGGLIKKPFSIFLKLSLIKKVIVIIIIAIITIGLQQYFSGASKNGYILEKAKITSITETIILHVHDT